MSNIVENNITLDLNRSAVQTIYAKQYDNNTRVINIEVVNKGNPVDIETLGYEVYFKGKTSKGIELLKHCELDENGLVVLELTSSMLLDQGHLNGEIVLVNPSTGTEVITQHTMIIDGQEVTVPLATLEDADVVSTMPFILHVKGATFEDGEISEDDYTGLNDLMATVQHMQHDVDSQEIQRQANENVRISNENTRIANEERREGTISQMQSDISDLQDNYVDKSQLGVATVGTKTGIATLGTNGIIPKSQLPSWTDDVLMGTMRNKTFQLGYYEGTEFWPKNATSACTPEEGKLYVDTSENIQDYTIYMYDSVLQKYLSIGSYMKIGITAYTAFSGLRGKVLEDTIVNKVDKVDGKGLSTEDFTTAFKTKLINLTPGGEPNTIESISVNGTTISPDVNKNVAITVMTNSVNDLVNYYLKSETYTKTEVDNIASAIKNSRFEVVNTLPTTDIQTNVIYLVPRSSSETNNIKDEYINLDGTTAGWEQIGSTDVDLSNYVTTSDLNIALLNYTSTTDLTTLLDVKVDKVNGKGLSENDYTTTEKTKLAGIESGAEVNVQADWNETNSSNDAYIRNKPSHLGHSVKDSTTTFTDRSNLKFTGNVSVTDDSTNDNTIVEILGEQDYVYDTYEDLVDDLANVEEGAILYTREEGGAIVTRVENLETNVTQINSNLSEITLKNAQIIDTTDVNGNITLPTSYNGKLIVSVRTTGELITYQIGYNVTTPFIHFGQFDGSILANYRLGFIVYYLEENI